MNIRVRNCSASYGVAVQRGIVAENVEQAVDAFHKVNNEFGSSFAVVKAQIHAGGRGKGGGVKLVKNLEELKSQADRILGMYLKHHRPRRMEGP